MLFDTKKCKQETSFLLGLPFGPEAGPFTSTFTLGALTSTSGTLTFTSGTFTLGALGTSGIFTRMGRPLPEPPDPDPLSESPDPDPCPDPRLEPWPDPCPDPFVYVAVTAAANVINQTYVCVVRYIGKKSFTKIR